MSDNWKPDFPNWKAKFPDLVWWLDYNTRKVPRGSLHKEMRPIVDNTTGLTWMMRVNPAGVPIGPVVRDHDDYVGSYKYAVSELKYDVWQYMLIVWCLQKMIFEDWKVGECYSIIKHFWQHLPGQAPLTSRSISMWVRIHRQKKKEGLLWP